MKIILHGKNIELTPAIREYVDEKIGHVEKILGGESPSVEARIEIGKPSSHHHKGPVYYAELNVRAGKMLFRATAEHDDVRTAIDTVRDEIQRQISKFKTKKQASRRGGNAGE